MKQTCLRIAELNLKLNDFADSTIFNVSMKRQKLLEAERYKLYVFLKMKYRGFNPDDVLTPINTKGIKFSTNIDEIEKKIKQGSGDKNGNRKQYC